MSFDPRTGPAAAHEASGQPEAEPGEAPERDPDAVTDTVTVEAAIAAAAPLGAAIELDDDAWRRAVRYALADPPGDARLERVLTPTAGAAGPLPQAVARDAEGGVEVEVRETAEARLELTVRAGAPLAELVRVSWRTDGDDAPDASSLVTPLVASGGEWQARYDIGAARHVRSLTLDPPRLAPAGEVTEAQV
ncbi:MAG: hypothetical protein ACKVWR_13645, partial [Acidimicrobiales bacterium]